MPQTVYIGTYTNAGSKGVYRASLADDGKLTLIDCEESPSPAYVIFSLDKKFVYAGNEAREIEGVPGGGVTAFEVRGDGSLKKIVSRPTGDGQPCHVLEHGGYLYAANYGAGNVTVYPLDKGVPGAVEFTHQHYGSGPNEKRQQGPRAHCSATVPGTDMFCVVDLGIDQVRFYKKAAASLELVQALALPGGAGPRHIVFSRDGRLGWVVTELSNEIYAIKRSGSGAGAANAGGEWVVAGKYSTLPPDFAGNSACAAIRLSPDGKLIAASNRGHESVACFGVDGATGLLTPKGIYPLGGKHPRDIIFSPDGKWLISANQDSDLVTVLSVADGFRLVEGASLQISRPTGVLC